MFYLTHQNKQHIPWNKGKLTGQKPPLKLAEIWAIRTRLQIIQTNPVRIGTQGSRKD